jgi:hypothetical protein
MMMKVPYLRGRSLYHPRPASENNKRKVIWIVVLLLLSLEIPETGTYLAYIWPSIKTEEADWFWLKGFHYSMAKFYYFKFTSERIAWILRMIAFTKTAKNYSLTIFLATLIILCYQCFDLLMFWVNFNMWPYLYEFVILYIYIVIRGLISPYRPDFLAKIKSIF